MQKVFHLHDKFQQFYLKSTLLQVQIFPFLAFSHLLNFVIVLEFWLNFSTHPPLFKTVSFFSQSSSLQFMFSSMSCFQLVFQRWGYSSFLQPVFLSSTFILLFSWYSSFKFNLCSFAHLPGFIWSSLQLILLVWCNLPLFNFSSCLKPVFLSLSNIPLLHVFSCRQFYSSIISRVFKCLSYI